MTPTQIARRSDALYADGTCGMTRRVLCDMVAQRESDLEDARAENAKLRNEVDNLLDFEHLTSVAVAYAGCDECGEYKQTMLCLFAENAKMRELLQDAWGYINHPADATWTHKKRKEVRDSIGDRMRELGIEVD